MYTSINKCSCDYLCQWDKLGLKGIKLLQGVERVPYVLEKCKYVI